MAGAVTIKDVAREASVSVATVSRVYNDHAQVTEDVKERVLKAAADLGYLGPRGRLGLYRQGGTACAASRALKDIGFLFTVDDEAAPENPFWSQILAGAESEARKHNIKLTYRVIGPLSLTPGMLLATIRQMGLNGLLLVGPADREVVEVIRSTSLPVVLVDNVLPHGPVDAVVGDNFEGAREAVAYLVSLGHRDVAFIGGPTIAGGRPHDAIYTIEQRAAGYRIALLDAGLLPRDELYEPGGRGLAVADGYAACQRLLARTTAFTALFCANDTMAIGALRALQESGRRVPDDVSVIGFDNMDMAAHLTPAMTTVRVHKRALGSVAVKTLIARAAHPAALPARITLPVELVIRASAGPPAG